MARMKKITKIYEKICLVVGFAAIIVLIGFLINFWGYHFFITEPLWFIRIPEIILGIIAIPYYLKKIYEKWIK